MAKDHLDNELSVSAELTDNGVQAKAKMRALSGLDRLIGSGFDRISATLEGGAAEKRAISAARVAVIKSLGEQAASLAAENPDAARAAMITLERRAFREYENKVGVTRHTIQDLSESPPSPAEAEAGEDELGEEFLARFERYAADASTEDLQIKWGKILAAEIRKPGSVSRKTMRIVDEIDADVARNFEEFARNRLERYVPRALVPSLTLEITSALARADLIIEPGFTGQVLTLGELNHNGEHWAWLVENLALAFPKTSQISAPSGENRPISNQNDGPAIPVFVLTEVGMEVANLVKPTTAKNFERYAQKLAECLPEKHVQFYIAQANGRLARTGIIEAEAT